MSQELVRIVDNIARDKNIDRESLFIDLEEAMVSAIRKHFNDLESEISVTVDRKSGDVISFKDGQEIDIRRLGRIPAQTAKQVMIQRIRADERSSIFSDYIQRKGEIISGAAVRYERGTLIVSLSHRVEGIMPKSEQILGQTHRAGERIRCLILEVKESGGQVKIILSRTHPDFIRQLFEQEVPEIAENIIEIRALSREAGYRTKVAVISSDDKVDPVGACVGVRGSRIKNIVDELGGEKIDIVRWSDSSQVLIANSLMPAKVSEIALCFELGRATVVVDEDQLSLAIGKHGQNVRLGARLTGWDIDILTPDEYNNGIERLSGCVTNIPGGDETVVDKLIALGVISVLDLEEVGVEPLVAELSIERQMAEIFIQAASASVKEAKRAKAGKTNAEPQADSSIVPENEVEVKKETEDEGQPDSKVAEDEGQPESKAVEDEGQPESKAVEDEGQPESKAVEDEGQPESKADSE